ncbi:hypothetical protein F5J12DRAFT_788454 [Pisolithus orientalis]|uniref:uncharacterized protein n=1 Tax=Pisolithus orientalis TaxID=936130 RepID=UPI00222599C8|nr:uncharacterized protein F5J12DRAFT_788454 [Pisolithus orientalis]KAI5981987.1 hypothetical protein F5J12DRAFT_788454 [Pisolithus orientalis]
MTPERPVKNVGKQIKSPLQPREREKEKKITMLPCPQPLGANTHYDNPQNLFTALQAKFCSSTSVEFQGSFLVSVDPLDEDKKQKPQPSQREGNTINQHTLSIRIKHTNAHTAYYDVTMPLEIQALYPHVTPAQVHSAWMKMSEILWKKDTNQLTSARTLLDECSNEVDIFDMKIPDGVEQICWGMKKISGMLEGKAVEIALDATYNTNAKHLELYSVLAEYDNAGFPLIWQKLVCPSQYGHQLKSSSAGGIYGDLYKNAPNVAKFEGRVLLEHDEIPHDNIMPSLSNHIPNPSFSITTKPDISQMNPSQAQAESSATQNLQLKISTTHVPAQQPYNVDNTQAIEGVSSAYKVMSQSGTEALTGKCEVTDGYLRMG